MAVGIQVTFDAADPQALAAFWGRRSATSRRTCQRASTAGRPGRWLPHSPARRGATTTPGSTPTAPAPRLYFQKVPEPKTAKNRVHLDLAVGGGPGTPLEEIRGQVAAAVERAVAAGATKLREVDEAGEHWVVLQDPEGNEFCLH